jgi:hypothetical protein
LNAITNLTIFQNAGLQTVALTGISPGSGGNPTVTISAVSSATNIISTPTLNYTNPASSGTLTFAPVSGATGMATITVTVNNGAASNNLVSQAFTVTVLPAPVVSQPPTLNAITNLVLYESCKPQTVILTGISAGSTNQNQPIRIFAVSSNLKIIPTPIVTYSSPNPSGILVISPATNALGSAIVTVTASNGCASNAVISRTFTVTVVVPPGGNQPPTMNPITNITLIQGITSQSVTLTGITSGSPTERQTLTLTATSSNTRLVPSPTIRYTSPAATAELTLIPSPTALGTATITVTVNDGGKSNNIVQQSFTVTIVTNRPPTLNPVANLVVAKGSASQRIILTGISSGSPSENQILTLSATSSNQGLIPSPTIQYTNPATTALLTLKPVANATGTAALTVTVNDGSRYNHLVSQSFTVTVLPPSTNSPSLTTINSTAALNSTSLTKGQFSFQVVGVSGNKYVVQTSSDLIHWNSIHTNTAPFLFQESTTNGAGQRFYRAYLP